MNISPVIDFALQYNPMLCTRDISTIFAWLNYGCDIELDILPTMKEIIKRRSPNKTKINSFSYFSNAIYEAFAKRTVIADKIKEPSKEEKNAIRAKNVKWHKVRGLTTTRVGLQDFTWLESYEKQHGEVIL